MTDHTPLTTLTDTYPSIPNLAQSATPLGTPLPYSDSLTTEESDLLSQLAADFLDDPIALQYLCDHIHALFLKDLAHQRSRP